MQRAKDALCARGPTAHFPAAPDTETGCPGLFYHAALEKVTSIAQLPETYRLALELRAYHELEEKQIADILGISYAATRKRLERARSLLAQKLKAREEGDLCEQESV